MTQRIVIAGALAVLALTCSATHSAERVKLREGDVDVYFAPEDDFAMYLGFDLSKSQRRVWLAGYSLTSPKLAQAVVQAKVRGLDVQVLLDSSTAAEKGGTAPLLHKNGVTVWVYPKGASMQHRFVICDEARIGFGSVDFTKAAIGGMSKNRAENFNLFVGVPELVKKYAMEFERLRSASTAYVPPTTERKP